MVKTVRIMSQDGKVEKFAQGIGVSKGIALGDAFVMLNRELKTPVYEIRDCDRQSEIDRFREAILKTRQQPEPNPQQRLQ